MGSFYGARLCRAGHEVHFLLRSDFDAVRRGGVWIESAEGSFRADPHCARAPGEIGPADLVLIGLKTTANHVLPQLLPPLIGPQTALLTLQNGLGNEAAIASIAPGKILHLAHGAVVLGEYGRPPQARTQLISQAIAGAGVFCKVAEHLEQARWEKLVWNIPFNGLGVAGVAGLESVLQGRIAPEAKRHGCLTTDLLLLHPVWEKLVRELMMETIAAARAQGLNVSESVADKQMERTRQMGPYKASTLIDYENGRALELEGLFLEPLRRARQAGVPSPRLAALCAVLAQLADGR